ncbi:uncharacterized protein LOC115604890 [Strigops habroptila]|uniref:uncharacterized protein LOC115604890 n=1 Tax=Strigops habroptila TaxID=2489341 RepID=UPI0011CF4FA6|nr:uncharacterized protein LOC115604890 [Strigops habroptila]XP_030334305.1 uncharacterized protein LOC115604890 [Strigops habroptila]
MSCYMYSTVIVIWLVLPIIIVGSLEVSLKREVVTYIVGQNATLSCRFTVPMGGELIRVIWEKESESFEVPEIIFDSKDKGLVGHEQELQENWQSRSKVMNRLWSRNLTEGETKLRIANLTEQMRGKYRCLVKTNNSIDYGEKIIYITKTRIRRAIKPAESPQIIQVPQRDPEENLMIGLIKDFAKMQNTSRITACLPIPKAAGEPIEWGIITIPLPEEDKTVKCQEIEVIKNVTKTEYDRKGLMGPILKSWCEQQLNFQFTQKGPGVGECIYDEKIEVKTQTKEITWNCQTKDNLEQNWDTIWSLSIVQKFRYGGNTSWCLRWSGKYNIAGNTNLLSLDRVSLDTVKNVPWWNCTRIMDCDTDPEKIAMPPIRIALKVGCACRGFKVGGKPIQAPADGINCRHLMIHSMGHLVWALSDGTWTTHLPITGPVREITLGLPTLCPIWKRSPFRGKLETLQIRTKRSIDDGIDNIDDTWQEPETGVKVGWALESLFAQIAAYRNREAIYNLIGQTERLAKVTKKGFRDLNLQLQATTKMTLQNRMALDTLLLKEHGVCGYLKDRIDHCCVHIPNVTADIEYDIAQLGKIEEEADKEKEEISQNWVGALFDGLGIHLTGWIHSLIETVCTLLLVFLVIYLVYFCIRREITRNTSWTHKIIGAVTREYPRHPITPPLTYQETTT